MNDFVKLSSVVGFAFFHAILPSHWLPLSIMAKKYKWGFLTLLGYITGTMGIHTVSTFFFAWILLRVGDLFFIGQYVEQSSKWGTILLGGFYLLGTRKKCEHDHTTFHPQKTEKYLLLFTMSAFSPCMELVPYLIYWGVPAVWRFWGAIFYILTTIFVVLSMSLVFMKGYEFIRLDFLKKNESHFMGVVLIFVGILMLFFE